MKNQRHRKRERGMALVMVMGVLAVSMLLIMHAMSVSQVISRDAYVSVQRSRLRYEAESGGDQAFWMHLTDRRLYTSRKLGATNESRASSDVEPWMADRRSHQLFGTNCQAYIEGVEKSIFISNTSSFSKCVDIEDSDAQERVTNFLNVLADYTDSDTTTRLNGKDEEEYAAEGLRDMPRNGEMQFKEELYWLEGWEEAVQGEVTMIPPSGKSLSTSTKPSFFAASESELRRILDIEDAELASVLEARRLWMDEGMPIEDSLSADLLVTVTSNFNFTEGDVSRYIVSSATEQGDIQVVYDMVRGSNLSATSIYADTASQAFSVWSRLIR